MNDPILSTEVPSDRDFTVRTDTTALYRVVHVESGTEIEFTVLAGQDFKVKSRSGTININIVSAEAKGAPPNLERIP